MAASHRYLITAPRGFEDLLEAELKGLGAGRTRRRPGVVEAAGTLQTGYRACLWSRLAEHVVLEVGRFRAADAEALYQGVSGILWREHLAASGTLAVSVSARGSVFRHSHFAALKVKDAVVDQFRAATGRRPSVDLERPDVRIQVFAAGDEVTVGIDLAGAPLHRRGYRAKPGAAPLKETLAAGILMRSGWPEIYREGGALADPMCGSGTFLIEAAGMALHRAPGALRAEFGFSRWRQHDEALWRGILAEAEAAPAERDARPLPVFGFDADPDAVAAAEINLSRAKLSGRITVMRQDLAGVRAPAARGLLVTNPPYGARLAPDDLEALYRDLGARLKDAFYGWRAAVLVGDTAPARAIGLKPRRSHRVFNGPIRCRLLRFQPGAARGDTADAATASAEPAPPATDFANRLRKSLRSLRRWAGQNGIGCYRVYDADVPEYALAVDLYGSETLWAHVQEYAPPRSVDARKAEQRLDGALAALPEVLDIPSERIVLKRRERKRGRSQYGRMAHAGELLEVRECGCRLLVNLTDRIDTGLYLDHREVRLLIRRLARDRRFLNLFAYTGAASVHAAAGGAASTLSIDMSATYCEWGLKNFALNGLEMPRHRYERADCLEWMADAPDGGFDLIFLDPPTFSNSKRMRRTLDVQRDHVDLIRATMRLLESGGILLFSNHARRFRLDRKALGDLQIEDISRQTLPRDFQRSPRIHNCWQIKHAT